MDEKLQQPIEYQKIRALDVMERGATRADTY
jgi:hypothetical protein